MSSNTAAASDGASSAGQDDASWKDWEASGDEEVQPAAQSLFETKYFQTVEEALQHDIKTFDFDLVDFIVKGKLGEYDIIKLINYIRSETSKESDVLAMVRDEGVFEERPWSDDQFLIPKLDDDQLLFHDFKQAIQSRSPMNSSAEPCGLSSEVVDPEELKYLRDQNQLLMQEIKLMKTDAATREALRSVLAVESEDTGKSTDWSQLKDALSDAVQSNDSIVKNIDDNYFDAYGQYEIHREMLGDKVRTEAYRDALEKNPALIRDKVVLDVGCGTGILSLFACRSRAAKVVAVDGSKWVAEKAERIAEKNGHIDELGGNMSILYGKLEDLDLKLENQVDVIVSEWMGYSLLFESMLDTVLAARDRCLRKGGAILPDIVKLKIAGASEQATGLDFWKDVYGFDMSPIRDELLWRATRQPMVQIVDQELVITDTVDVKELDLITMAPSDANFHVDFEVKPINADAESACHAFVMWFDALFSARFCAEHPVELSTSPFSPPTHWAQTVLTLRNPVVLGGEKGAVGIKCRLSMSQGDSHRSIDLSIEYTPMYKSGLGDRNVALFVMAIGQKAQGRVS